MRSLPECDTRRAALVVVAGVTVLGLALRLVVVGQSTWADELYLYDIVHNRSLSDSLRVVHDTESTPPFYFVAAWLATQTSGDDFLLIRIPSLLLSTATVPLVYLLGSRTVGRAAGCAAAALFALIAFDIYYGTEGRTYAAVAFFSVASTLCVLELVRTGRRRVAFGTAVTVALAAYCHYTVVFVLLAQFVWAGIMHRERLRLLSVAYAGALLLYVPWIPGALYQFQDNTSDRLGVVGNVGRYGEVVGRAAIGHPYVPLSEVPGTVAALVMAAGLLLGAVTLPRRRPAATTVLLITLAVITPLAAAGYELTGATFFSPRYMSASVPAMTVVMGALATASGWRPASGWRTSATAATALVLAGAVTGTVTALSADHQRPQFRQVARALDRIAVPTSPVVEFSVFVGPPGRELGYFFRKPHEYFPVGRPLDEAYRLGHESGHFYMVLPETDVSILKLYAIESHGFRLAERRHFSGIVPLLLLTYADASHRLESRRSTQGALQTGSTGARGHALARTARVRPAR